MKRPFGFAILLLTAFQCEVTASPAGAMQVEKTFNAGIERWNLEMKAAATPEQRAEIAAKRPDATAAARKMWAEIGASLSDEWTLAPAAWFLRVTPGLLRSQPDGSMKPTFADEIDDVRDAIVAHHLRSPKLIPVCMALVTTQDPKSLAVLEKIRTTNPDPKVQGVAALAEAMLLKNSADSPEIMRRRLTCLRKAIVDSSDVDLGGVSVAQLAEDELHVILHLTKGRVAPDLSGFDSGGRPMKLSDFTGKVVMLVFWSSKDPEAGRLVEMANEWTSKFADRPLVVIGVNHDDRKTLRELEENQVLFRNFSDPGKDLAKEYRVGTWPLVYVLGKDRVIGYSGAPGSFAELSAEAMLAGTQP